MALTVVVFAIFAVIFFLLSNYKGNTGFISAISDAFKPPHKRIKKVVVGNPEASNNTILRIEKEAEEIHYNESDRNSGGDNNNFKTPTSCIIKIPNSND